MEVFIYVYIFISRNSNAVLVLLKLDTKIFVICFSFRLDKHNKCMMCVCVRVVFRSCVSIRIEQRICLSSHVQILIILTKLNSRAAYNVFCMLAMPLPTAAPAAASQCDTEM